MGRSLPAVVTGGGCDTGSQDSLIMAKKKGFMTPERKKKLRTLLRKKAAEELKKEQERKAEERLRVIAERCGTKADIENASVDDLKKICQQYFDKWYKLEAEMFFLQREVILRDLQINELTISVSDMKGKFIKPSLKKVSKYGNKFAKLQEKAAKFAFANQLKQSKGYAAPSFVTMTDSIPGQSWLATTSLPLLDDFIQFCHCHVLLVSLLLPSFST